MKSYVVHIYRCEKNKPRSLVGVVEEVGVKEKKAFIDIDDFWNILRSVRKETGRVEKSGTSSRGKYGVERRDEVRMKKELPIVFVHKKRNLDACTVNYSKNGLGIKIFRKVALPVGEIINLKARNSGTKAQVIWTKHEIDPHITLAGLKIVDGALNLKGARKNLNLMMKYEKNRVGAKSISEGEASMGRVSDLYSA